MTFKLIGFNMIHYCYSTSSAIIDAYNLVVDRFADFLFVNNSFCNAKLLPILTWY